MSMVEKLESPELYRFLTIMTPFVLFILMVLGSYVKAIGAGLACPDWPLCHGQLIPLEYGNYSFVGVMAEWVHRLVALVVGFMLLGLLSLSYVNRDEKRGDIAVGMKRVKLMVLIMILLVVQFFLGGFTVLLLLDEYVVTSHLAFATIILGLSILHWFWQTPSYQPQIRNT